MSYLYQLLGIWELDRHLVIRPVMWAKLHRGGQVCYLNEDGSKPTLMECLMGSIQSGEGGSDLDSGSTPKRMSP